MITIVSALNADFGMINAESELIRLTSQLLRN
ncbi:hypothetical protein GLO73106DRAFT_00036730 [Gloeocapsa sp. PCC 73106]|nr:hypothetical protein GLO73106DRAFT_00036730 [Gloeocapsa sp. PCC 73106]